MKNEFSFPDFAASQPSTKTAISIGNATIAISNPIGRHGPVSAVLSYETLAKEAFQ